MKKALHKLTLAVLIAAFILTLAGCGSDDTLKKNITGSWACRGIDVTDMILEGMLEGVSGDAEAEEFISNMNVGVLTVDYLLDIREDGTFVLSIDPSSAGKLADQFSAAMADVMYTYLETELEKLANENGMTLDEVISVLGCSNIDEAIESSLGGQSLAEYCDGVFAESDIQDILAEGTESGTYSVKSGKILLSAADAAISLIEYDEKSDTVSLTESGFDEPFIFTRR